MKKMMKLEEEDEKVWKKDEEALKIWSLSLILD
jgi:hypothetical protein